MTLLRDLAARKPYAGRIALVVAHPDDEAIAAGGSLSLLPNLLLVHLTDGAPRNLPDWQDHGFPSPHAYAQARAAELRAALAAAGCDAPHLSLGLPDQEASLHLAATARHLATLFAGHAIDAVLTHAYEGGHPDHDAAAWATRAAARLGPASPAIFEFPSYHAGLGAPVNGEFLPGPDPVAIHLTDAEQACKARMFAAHATQACILAGFTTGREAFRAAPAYDWTRPPHTPPLNYERWNWEMTGERWRTLAAAAERELWP